MPENPDADLYVVGLGIKSYRQITKEVEEALEAADRIYLFHYQRIVVEYLRQYSEDIIDVNDHYDQGQNRGEIYRTIATDILEDARSGDETIVYAVYGHPTVFVTSTKILVEESESVDVEVLPGLSATDTLLVDLNLDPGKTGLQSFDATSVLLREIELNNEVPLFLWQIGALETKLHSNAPSAPERFTRLREYLQRYYPDDHEVFLVRSAPFERVEAKQIGFPLDEFESMHDEIDVSFTLYVPPVNHPPVRNEELAEQLESEEHLERITESGTKEIEF